MMHYPAQRAPTTGSVPHRRLSFFTALVSLALLATLVLPPHTARAAPATQFVVTVASPQTAGAPFDVTVEASDGVGTDMTYTGTVTFTTTDAGLGVVLPADYTFTGGDAGIHTFT